MWLRGIAFLLCFSLSQTLPTQLSTHSYSPDGVHETQYSPDGASKVETSPKKPAETEHTPDGVSGRNLSRDVAVDSVVNTTWPVTWEPASQCQQCPPGEGAVRLCTPGNDTVCAPCAEGYHQIGWSVLPCQPCTDCPLGHYKRTPCSSHRSTLCTPCSDFKGAYGNEDFLKNCEVVVSKLLGKFDILIYLYMQGPFH